MAKPVIHDNDGHVDDLLSALLLWLSPAVDLQAITITAGDSYPDQSFAALLKMATFLDLEGPEIAFTDDAVPNPFPENRRRESNLVNSLPLFSENELKKPYQPGASRRSHQVIADCLQNSRAPVTFVTTGPLTNVSRVFADRPELKTKVSEFVIMGGALKVKGNVEQDNSDGSAEWNFYCDPKSVKAVFDLGLPITLVPLDVTNLLPFEKDFLARVQVQAPMFKASRLAVALWSLVKSIQYYFWDTVTAAAIIKPELFTFKEFRVDVSTQGMAQGRVAPVLWGGRKIKAAVGVDKEGFRNFVLEVLRTK